MAIDTSKLRLTLVANPDNAGSTLLDHEHREIAKISPTTHPVVATIIEKAPEILLVATTLAKTYELLIQDTHSNHEEVLKKLPSLAKLNNLLAEINNASKTRLR